jgi:AcrR family transcriptional regulator
VSTTSHGTPAPSLREAQKQFTHRRLVEAAEAEFDARGYRATTIEDIVAHAGATRATFYLHFRSKADVVLEMIESARAEFHPVWDLLRELPRRPSRARVREWIVGAADSWEQHAVRNRVIIQAVHAEPDLAQTRAAREEEVLDRLVAAVRHLGWEDDAHARLECMLLLAELERALAYWYDVEEPDVRVLDVLAERWRAAFLRAARAAG